MPTYKRIRETKIFYDCLLKKKRGFNNIECTYPELDYCYECFYFKKLEYLEGS